MRWKPLLAALGTAALLAAIPLLQRALGFSVYYLVFLYFIFFWVAQATSWNLFSGYAGMFSFGQVAFLGTGVYTVAILIMRYGWSLPAALPVAAALAGLLAFTVGWIVFRLRSLRGELFSLFTLVVGIGGGYVANSTPWIDGGQGIALTRVGYPALFESMTEYLYYLGLGTAVLAVSVAAAIQYSRLGRGLFAIHDDERVAEGLGVPTFRYKLTAFTINGLLAGLSGGIHAVQMNYVAVDSVFTLHFSLYAIL
ncbi:MAG: branched-chain amino acid ABC transporter permease [Limnochordales bacterium]